MTSFMRRLIVAALCATWTAPALAERFFMRYDADDGMFPEEKGWVRWPGDPPEGEGVTRNVENGVFRINSMASPENADLYWLEISDLMPGPGEYLRVDWRMRVLYQDVDDLPWFGDAAMHIGRSYGEYASMYIAPDKLSVMTPEFFGYQLFPFERGAWHSYSFITDMHHYDLFVDGGHVMHSYLYAGKPDIADPNVVWGDSWSYTGSCSEWDYVQVSIVPEPDGIVVIIVGLVLLQTARRGI